MSFELPLIEAGLKMQHIENNTIVPMYQTSIECETAGQFSGKMVVSMRPLNAKDAIKSIEISSRFPAVHGAPIHLGNPDEIGIKDIMKPEFGDPPRIGSVKLRGTSKVFSFAPKIGRITKKCKK